MPWNIPPTFTPNQVVSDTDLNNYLRDNPIYLGSGKVFAPKYRSAAYSSTSLSFVDIDAANLILNITNSASGRVICFLSMWVANSNVNNNYGAVTLIMDSATYPANHDTTYGLFTSPQAQTDYVCAVGYWTGVSNAAHSIKLQWKAGIATGNVSNGASAPYQGITMFAMEG